MFTPQVVTAKINKLYINSCAGPETRTHRVLKQTINAIASLWPCFFAVIFHYREVRNRWREIVVTQIKKTVVLCHEMFKYLHIHNLINKKQDGFLANHAYVLSFWSVAMTGQWL